MSDSPLAGQRAWLIGASSGIGAALADALARRGVRLAISARDEAALRRVAAATPGVTPMHVVPLDVTDAAAFARGHEVASAALGGIDLLIYSAGTWARTSVHAYDTAAIEHAIAVNLTGLTRAVGLVLPEMRARGAGRIVGIASVAGYRGIPGAEGYSATKAGAIAFLEALRVDLAPRGIAVTTVNPGFVRTPLTDRNDFPMPFLMESEEAARRIVRGLERHDREIHFPLRLTLPMKLVRLLPAALYERLAARLVRGRR